MKIFYILELLDCLKFTMNSIITLCFHSNAPVPRSTSLSWKIIEKTLAAQKWNWFLQIPTPQTLQPLFTESLMDNSSMIRSSYLYAYV